MDLGEAARQVTSASAGVASVTARVHELPSRVCDAHLQDLDLALANLEVLASPRFQ